MDFKTKIVHWNCRGLKPNYNEILLLLSLLKPAVFCLQETFLKQEDNINFKGFNLYNKASQAIQSPRTVPFFLLVSLLDGYTFANVLVKGIVAFKH